MIDKEFNDWVNSLSKSEVEEILYEFFLCLLEDQEEEDEDERAIKFHQDSILKEDDDEVALLSYEILKERWPERITKDIEKEMRRRFKR